MMRSENIEKQYRNMQSTNLSVTLITLCYSSQQKACPNPVKEDFLRHHQALLHQQQNEEYVKLKHIALAGIVWNDELKKMADYRDLIKHRDSIIQNQWTCGSENVFGRLFQ